MAMTIARSRARMELREAQRRWTYGGRTDETRGGLMSRMLQDEDNVMLG